MYIKPAWFQYSIFIIENFNLMYKFLIIVIFFFSSLHSISQQKQAVSPDTIKVERLKDVEITGRVNFTSKTSLSTEASSSPASVSLVGRDYIAKQAITSYGDLLRPIAGVNVSNYQLGGVGYGIQIRGYTVTEHARDVAFIVDGVPQNQGSSIQTNGYVDLNPLIPEHLRRIEVTRGPFTPFYGDHALGGVISFETMDKMPSSITVSAGSFGAARVLGTAGFGQNNKTGYVSIEAGRIDGYRDNSNEKHVNGFAKYAFPLMKGMASIRAQGYSSDFGSSGYLRLEDLNSGKVSRTTAVNSTDGGTTRQQNIVFNYKGLDTSNFTSATVYIQHHDFIRIRTGVIGGSQRQDRDNRVWAGADLRRTIISTLGSLPVLYAVGFSFRADNIDNTRFTTKDRQKVNQTQDRQINTYTPGIYFQLQLQATGRLKLTLGGRYDKLLYDLTTGITDSELPNKRLKPNTGVLSPKAGMAYQIVKGVNIFINAAQGFKAPSGYEENLFNPGLSVSKLTTYEIGVGGDDAEGRFHGLLSAYLSDQTGEIQSDPLGNLTNFGDTRRSGFEAEGRAALIKRGGLSIFGNYTRVTAKIRNGATDQNYVTNTPEYAATLGFDYDFGAARSANNHLVLSIYDQLIGNKNLNASGTIRSDAFHRLAGKLSYNRNSWANFRLFAEGSFYPGDGALKEVNFLSGGKILISPQARVNIRGGVRIPF